MRIHLILEGGDRVKVPHDVPEACAHIRGKHGLVVGVSSTRLDVLFDDGTRESISRNYSFPALVHENIPAPTLEKCLVYWR